MLSRLATLQGVGLLQPNRPDPSSRSQVAFGEHVGGASRFPKNASVNAETPPDFGSALRPRDLEHGTRIEFPDDLFPAGRVEVLR
jgi:hypothetical protein